MSLSSRVPISHHTPAKSIGKSPTMKLPTTWSTPPTSISRYTNHMHGWVIHRSSHIPNGPALICTIRSASVEPKNYENNLRLFVHNHALELPTNLASSERTKSSAQALRPQRQFQTGRDTIEMSSAQIGHPKKSSSITDQPTNKLLNVMNIQFWASRSSISCHRDELG